MGENLNVTSATPMIYWLPLTKRRNVWIYVSDGQQNFTFSVFREKKNKYDVTSGNRGFHFRNF